MRIVIDMQGAQSESRFRGIGRYVMGFTEALIRNRGSHEIVLALNGLLADSIEPLRAAFEGLLPDGGIQVWETPGPVGARDPVNTARRRIAECVREAFLASLHPDLVIVTSLFEGYVDDAVTSIGRHASLRTAVIFYDAIPLIYPEYLSDPTYADYYLAKVDHIRRADYALAISGSSAKEACKWMGFAADRVRNIAAGCNEDLRPRSLSEADWAHLAASYGIPGSFLLYVGGGDARKNLARLIRAYARLPKALRSRQRLVIAGQLGAAERQALGEVTRQAGLAVTEVIVTRYVSDEDLDLLYNACQCLVVPSWHEGFGLPALEAMRCGRAVLVANAASLPEVVGRADALFDPFDEADIAAKMQQVLEDEGFRQELERHGRIQAQHFSWEKTAKRAMEALESWVPSVKSLRAASDPGVPRPRLAYVSPVPPMRTGIADYSAELLRELTRWYRIDVVVDQPEVSDPWIRANCGIVSAGEFRERRTDYDRVLYHVGNSPFHIYMFDLLEEIPGSVVLHDVVVSDAQRYGEASGLIPHGAARAALQEQGYWVLKHMRSEGGKGLHEGIPSYAGNELVLQKALGIITHSRHAMRLAQAGYAYVAPEHFSVIPHMRAPAPENNRGQGRKMLGIAEHAVVFCVFGFVGPSKLNHVVLRAFLASPLAQDAQVQLIFVGENDGGTFGRDLNESIVQSGLRERIRITGWIDKATYAAYLQATDIAVQLRAGSRGESSGTVLDCMNYGVPTIVNAHGSLVELNKECVHMLPDTFSDAELIEAMVHLRQGAADRARLKERSLAHIRERHAPRECAQQYVEAIEGAYRRRRQELPGLLDRMRRLSLTDGERRHLSLCLAQSFPPVPRRKQLLVDVSAIANHDLKTGIERVVRSVLRNWLQSPPPGWRVEPVRATSDGMGYCYARRFTARFLGLDEPWLQDDRVEAWAGDVFVGLDLVGGAVARRLSVLDAWRRHGVKVWFVVYDLLPARHPEWFPLESGAGFTAWLETITAMDGALCISESTANDLGAWCAENSIVRHRAYQIAVVPMMAELDGVQMAGVPDTTVDAVMASMKGRVTFLMVGTIEPRKGHRQVLEAFEELLQEGTNVSLVIVGKKGWMVEELVTRIKELAKGNDHIAWLGAVSDEALERVYGSVSCLIAASEGEGFGLPLIEAARHKLPIIARDIPVFREVARGRAFYFSGTGPQELASAIKDWLSLYEAGDHPASTGMPWYTARQTADRMVDILTGKVSETAEMRPGEPAEAVKMASDGFSACNTIRAEG